MNYYARSIKCVVCGLVHAYQMNGICPNCGSFNHPAKPQKGKTVIYIIAAAIIAACVSVVFVFAAQRNRIDEQPFVALQQGAQQQSTEQYVTKAPIGLIVTSLTAGGPAMSAGLQQSDIIIQYGDTEVVDDATFYRAREKYIKARASGVEMTVVRGGRKVKLTVPTGRLGFLSDEFNSDLMEFNALIKTIVGLRKLSLPDYERAVKEGFNNETVETMEQKAGRLIDKAEREGTLTKEQIMTARIYLIPDKATPQDEKKRLELIDSLIHNMPKSFALMLGNDRFFRDEKYSAAAICMEEGIKADPSNTGVLLNLSIAYNHVGMFKKADAVADYVINNLSVSEYGYGVAYQNKALAALGRSDYRNSMAYAEKSFELHPNDYMMSLWLLAAAENGDIQQFYAISEKCRSVLPSDYARLKVQVEGVEAYALAKSKRVDGAQEIVGRWKGTEKIAERISRYWVKYPSGSNVANYWKEAAS